MRKFVELSQSVAPMAIAAGLAIGLATSASAATIATVDIGGVSVDGGATDVLMSTVVAGTVDEIYFDFDVQIFGGSWASEVEITIEAPDTSTFFYDGSSNFGFPSSGSGSGAIHSFTGSFAIADTSAAGEWTFTFSDDFDDGLTPDHLYLSGSNIELRGEMGVIPLPAGIGLSLSALAALGFVARRRRKI